MVPIIPAPIGGAEIVPGRTLRGKLFDMGGQSRKIITGMTAAHVPDDIPAWEAQGSFNWLDVDTDIEFRGGVYRPKRCWHDCQVDPSKLAYAYFSKRRGDVEVALTKINGTALRNLSLTISPTVENGNQVWFRNVMTDLDFYFEFGPARARAYKVLRSGVHGVPLSLEWEVSRGADEDVRIQTVTYGQDNLDRQGRSGEEKSRTIEMTHSRTPDETVSRPGRTTFQTEETFTGRTRRVDPQTRVPGFVSDRIYPVRIDQDVTENIAADADDGYGRSYGAGQWTPGYAGAIYINYSAVDNQVGGWRFLTVGVPNAATIDSGTVLKLYHMSGNNDVDVSADDVDDAPIIQDSDAPDFDWTLTTAKNNAYYINGDVSIPIANVIQEIVDHGGWASGNDIRLCAAPTDSGDTGNLKIEDYGGAGQAAILEINYTAGGGGFPFAANVVRKAVGLKSSGAVM